MQPSSEQERSLGNNKRFFVTFAMQKAFLAQSVEQLIRNEQVAGSSPVKGSLLIIIPFYPSL